VQGPGFDRQQHKKQKLTNRKAKQNPAQNTNRIMSASTKDANFYKHIIRNMKKYNGRLRPRGKAVH
jgi:hypothetical protein